MGQITNVNPVYFYTAITYINTLIFIFSISLRFPKWLIIHYDQIHVMSSLPKLGLVEINIL